MSMTLLVILLMVVGLVLLALEILVIPGFGLVGILGCGAVLAACTVAWLSLGPGYGLLALAAGVVTTALLFWIFPKTSTGRAMVLKETQRGARAGGGRLAELVGREGKALTPLRPAGSVEIGDRTVDVVTDGVYVGAGAPVRVVKVEGARVVVEPREEPRLEA
jgi:membrane-bound serine protease (ClpP class)